MSASGAQKRRRGEPLDFPSPEESNDTTKGHGKRPATGGSIVVSRAVFDGIEAVRLSGLTNMLDRTVVARLVEEMGYEESARWVRENGGLYSRAVFQGFEIL